MDKEITARLKRCEECSELKTIKGVACCYECFDQPCADIDDCPLGITIESVKSAQTLTEEQKKVEKVMKNSENHAKSEKIERKKRENPEKEGIIADLAHFLNENDYNSVEITNNTREITFFVGNQHYKLNLIATRKPKA